MPEAREFKRLCLGFRSACLDIKNITFICIQIFLQVIFHEYMFCFVAGLRRQTLPYTVTIWSVVLLILSNLLITHSWLNLAKICFYIPVLLFSPVLTFAVIFFFFYFSLPLLGPPLESGFTVAYSWSYLSQWLLQVKHTTYIQRV